MAAIRTLDGNTIELDALVVMPDRVHAIFRVIGPHGLIHVLKLIKGRTARSINEQLGRRGPVWMQESFDHVVRNSAELEEKVDHIRQNPVRKALATSPQDYQWLYVKK